MAGQDLRVAPLDRSESIESASLDELRALQVKRLKQTIARAALVPQYRKKFAAAGVAPEAALAAEEALAPHYILEVTRPDRLDELEVVVETRAMLSPEAAMMLAKRAAHHIKAQVGVTAKVRAVAPGTIERSQGKAKRVIDKRPRT